MAGKKTMDALTLYKKGFNCAQAVILPFCDELGLDKATAMKLSEGFGAGMGACKLTCGALSGAVMAAGLINSKGDPSNPTATKQDTYLLSRALTETFQKEVGSCNCCDIKGLETKRPLKTCDECVIVATQLIEQIIKNKDK